MKKAIKMLSALMCMAAAVMLGMTSCDQIKDSLDSHDPNEVKSVNAEYSVNLSQTWFDYFDIVVTYYDELGKEHSLAITEKWEYGFSVKPGKAPKNYVMTVVGTPKKEYPELDKEQYIFSEDITANFYGLRYDGSIYKESTWSDLYPVTMVWDGVETLNRYQMETRLASGARNIAVFTHSFDGDY